MQEGIATCVSHHSVDETITRLQALLGEKTIKIFCLVDHAAEAATVNLALPPTKVLIFGSPRAGTPVMIDAPSAALDLPLKILVAEAADGSVRLSWNDPAWLQQRHGFSAELTSNLQAVALLAHKAAE